MHWVYVLRSDTHGRLYTGVTSDMKRRLAEHNAGKTPSLRNRRPLRLVYFEIHDSKSQAWDRERYFKTAEGGALKQSLVERAEAQARDKMNEEGWQSG